MQVTLHEVSEIARRLEISVPADEVRGALDAAYAKIQEKARLKGFRPGKAPRAVLEQYYRQDAESEAIRSLINASYPEALREVGLAPVSMPEVTVKTFGDGQDLTYDAVVEVRPVFEVKGHRGIKLTREKIVVTDEEVTSGLKNLQERSAHLVPVTTGRKATAGDLVLLDYQGFDGDRPIRGVEAKDYQVELGRGVLLPEFESGLLETAAGEKKRIPVTFPPDSADKKFAGKTVSYEVTLKEIKEKKMPELNDDFAKDLNLQTLDEVKARIRSQIEKDKERAIRGQFRREIIEQLVRENPFPVPEGLVRWELEENLHRLETNLKSQGVTLEQLGLTREGFFEKNRPEALLRVQGDLLFDAIAQKEGIEVTDEAADRKIEEMAADSGESAEVWKRHYREKNQLPGLKVALRMEKVLDFVLSEAKIKAKE